MPAALVLLAGALGVTQGPAGAVGPETGLAVAAGTESIDAVGEGLPVCLEVAAGATYTVETEDGVDGRVTADDSASVYTGTVRLTLTVPGTHNINPAGAFEDASRRSGTRSGATAPWWERLTRTERRVAALAARSHTNAEIAGALAVSVRTVETHVRNILRKLAIRSRRELARLAEEASLDDQNIGSHH